MVEGRGPRWQGDRPGVRISWATLARAISFDSRSGDNSPPGRAISEIESVPAKSARAPQKPKQGDSSQEAYSEPLTLETAAGSTRQFDQGPGYRVTELALPAQCWSRNPRPLQISIRSGGPRAGNRKGHIFQGGRVLTALTRHPSAENHVATGPPPGLDQSSHGDPRQRSPGPEPPPMGSCRGRESQAGAPSRPGLTGCQAKAAPGYTAHLPSGPARQHCPDGGDPSENKWSQLGSRASERGDNSAHTTWSLSNLIFSIDL